MNRPFRTIRSALLSIAALSFLFGIALTRAAMTSPQVTSIEGITEYRLNNGLRVLLFPDPTRPAHRQPDGPGRLAS